MNLKQFKTLGAAVMVATLFGTPSLSAHAQMVKVDGSSTVFPITEAVAEEFQKSKKGKIKVTVGISGTGGGFKKFCRGETDISDASRPILQEEMEACRAAGIEYIELPIAYDALTVVVNPQEHLDQDLTVAELKKMWEPARPGQGQSWNQVNPAWPDQPLKLFGPGADSGTFDYFTEAVIGKAKSSRGDYTASEDDNVLVQGVARDDNALGYFGYAYYIENKDKLKAVPIVNRRRPRRSMPSIETVIDGTYQPLSRPIFIYVNAKSLAQPEVKEFVEFYIEARRQARRRRSKYVPLPERRTPSDWSTSRGKKRHGVRRRARGRRHDRGTAEARSASSESSRTSGRRGASPLLPVGRLVAARLDLTHRSGADNHDVSRRPAPDSTTTHRARRKVIVSARLAQRTQPHRDERLIEFVLLLAASVRCSMTRRDRLRAALRVGRVLPARLDRGTS